MSPTLFLSVWTFSRGSMSGRSWLSFRRCLRLLRWRPSLPAHYLRWFLRLPAQPLLVDRSQSLLPKRSRCWQPGSWFYEASVFLSLVFVTRTMLISTGTCRSGYAKWWCVACQCRRRQIQQVPPSSHFWAVKYGWCRPVGVNWLLKRIMCVEWA